MARALLTGSLWPSLRPLSTTGVMQFLDIAYTGSGLAKHRLDVFVPVDPPFPRPLSPVLMFVHGGAWQRGDKRWGLNLYWNVGVAAARAGCVGVVINYRLSPQVRHPAHLDDVRAAWVWLHHHAARFGGDPSRIVLAGHSAGAHLAMLAASTPWPASTGAGGRVTCAGVIGISGVYDLLRLGTSVVAPSITMPAFGDSPGDLTLASPLHHVACPTCDLHAAATPPPPLLLLSAEEDFHLGEDADALARAVATARSSWRPLPGADEPVSIVAPTTILPTATTKWGMGTAWSNVSEFDRVGVRRGVVKQQSHLTIIAGVGQEQDATTAAITAFMTQLRAAT